VAVAVSAELSACAMIARRCEQSDDAERLGQLVWLTAVRDEGVLQLVTRFVQQAEESPVVEDAPSVSGANGLAEMYFDRELVYAREEAWIVLHHRVIQSVFAPFAVHLEHWDGRIAWCDQLCEQRWRHEEPAGLRVVTARDSKRIYPGGARRSPLQEEKAVLKLCLVVDCRVEREHPAADPPANVRLERPFILHAIRQSDAREDVGGAIADVVHAVPSPSKWNQLTCG